MVGLSLAARETQTMTARTNRWGHFPRYRHCVLLLSCRCDTEATQKGGGDVCETLTMKAGGEKLNPPHTSSQ